MAQKTAKPDTDPAAPPDRAAIEAQIGRIRADLAALGGMMQAYGRAQISGVRTDFPPHEALAELQRQLSTLEGEMTAKVRENPLQSLGLAALVGLIAGLMLRR